MSKKKSYLSDKIALKIDHLKIKNKGEQLPWWHSG